MAGITVRYMELDLKGYEIIRENSFRTWYEDGSYTVFTGNNGDSFIIPTSRVIYIESTKE